MAKAGRFQRAPTLPEEVTRVLREEIASGILRPGDRLPTEQKLSARFGVSRAVIREGVSRLKYDGLVSSRQGLGAFVTEPARRHAFRIEPAALEDRADLSEVFELRITLEVEAAALAAERRKARHLVKMRRALRDMGAAVAENRDGVEADAAFHKAIAEATCNTYFSQFMEFIRARIYASIQATRSDLLSDRARAETDIAEHRAIFEAIDARDPAAARRAVRVHLGNAAGDLKLLRPLTRNTS